MEEKNRERRKYKNKLLRVFLKEYSSKNAIKGHPPKSAPGRASSEECPLESALRIVPSKSFL